MGGETMNVCREIMWEWRWIQRSLTIINLNSASLKINVSKKLWKCQLVKYNGNTYNPTGLGFGLNSILKIMLVFLKTIPDQNNGLKWVTNSYIENILMEEPSAMVEEVISHLNQFGLKAKQPELLACGTGLGLQMTKEGTEKLVFWKGIKFQILKLIYEEKNWP